MWVMLIQDVTMARVESKTKKIHKTQTKIAETRIRGKRGKLEKASHVKYPEPR